MNPGLSSAQQFQFFDTSFANTLSKEFFERNKEIKGIDFSSGYIGYRYVSIETKLQDIYSPASKKIRAYNLNFIGDRYLFEKKYGHLALPEKEIKSIVEKKCNEFFILRLRTNADSIK
jgi:hypothetical protein